MARTKQRETYGNGSVSPVMVSKRDAVGRVVLGKDGKPVKVQERDKHGLLVWRVCVSLGTEEYTDKNGKLRKRQLKAPQQRVHGSLEDARRIAKQLTADYENLDTQAALNDFTAVADMWLEMAQAANLCGKDQLNQYRRHFGYMAPYLGGKPIAEIKKQDVERAFAAAKKERGLSNTTMHAVYQQTKRLFEYACDCDMVLRNPCRSIEPPRIDKVVTRRALSAEDAARLRACLDRDEAEAYGSFKSKEQRQAYWGHKFTRSALRGISELSGYMAVRMMLATGCRRGESLALTWQCVDFDNSQITIRRTLNQRGELKEPKTGAGVRTLYVDADTMEHLRTWKAFQAKALHLVMAEDSDGRRHAVEQTEETPVCCSDVGGWFDPTNVGRWWSGYRKAIGFDSLKMHELRHTSATLLLGNGVDVKTVQHRLGHASAALTLNQYAHAIPANDKAAAELMGALCGPEAYQQTPIVGLSQTA